MGMAAHAMFISSFNFLFRIFSLLNDVGSISDCVASNCAWLIGKDEAGSSLDIAELLSLNLPELTEENNENFISG